MALRAGAREEVRSIERNSLDVVDFLGAEAPVDAGGQLERVLGSRSHERFHSDLDALAFRNSGAFDRLENSVLEDCLEGGFHRLTTFRSPWILPSLFRPCGPANLTPGRRVDLVTAGFLSPHFRPRVVHEAVPLYEAA